MKIRSPWLIKIVGFVGAMIIRLWGLTLRPTLREMGEPVDPRHPDLQQRFIYVFWHEHILTACAMFGRKNIAVLISQHADGEMIAQACKYVGFETIRGSTTRGGIQAMRQMIRAIGSSHISVVPDGPRGPRQQLEKGIIYLASKTGFPIVASGISYNKPWRLNTWDKFVLPRPFASSIILASDPIHVPPDIDKDQIDHYRQIVQDEMDRLGNLADDIRTGKSEFPQEIKRAA